MTPQNYPSPPGLHGPIVEATAKKEPVQGASRFARTAVKMDYIRSLYTVQRPSVKQLFSTVFDIVSRKRSAVRRRTDERTDDALWGCYRKQGVIGLETGFSRRTLSPGRGSSGWFDSEKARTDAQTDGHSNRQTLKSFNSQAKLCFVIS